MTRWSSKQFEQYYQCFTDSHQLCPDNATSQMNSMSASLQGRFLQDVLDLGDARSPRRRA